MFNVLCSDKIQNCAGNHASLEQFLKVIGKRAARLVLSLAQIKLFSTLIIDDLLIIFVDKGTASEGQGWAVPALFQELSLPEHLSPSESWKAPELWSAAPHQVPSESPLGRWGRAPSPHWSC